MKILFVIPYFYPAQAFGGSVKVVFNIGKELVKRGHEVVVFTSDAKDLENQLNVESDEIEGMKVYYLRNLSMFFVKKSKLFITSELTKRINSDLKSFDIIHTHEYRTYQNIIVHKIAKKYGVSYIFQAHGSLPRIGREARKWLYDFLFGRRILKDASKVIALSRVEAEQYKDMSVPKDKIEIIPNGIDLSEYADLPPRGCFKKKFNIEKDEKIVLYLGRIHRIKGLDILVKAFAKVIEKLDDVRLVVVGPDDGYLGELEALIKALKMEDNVLISGPLFGKDKLEAYVDANMYVLPSRYETFPMSVLEAIACRTPVILTTNCGVADYFKNKTGLVVELDSNSLGDAMLEMLLRTELCSTLKGNCSTVVKDYSISNVVSRLEEVYEATLRSPMEHP